MTTDMLSMNLAEMQKEIIDLGLPAFRGKQLFRQIHKNGVIDFNQITDFPKDLRCLLAEKYNIAVAQVIDQSQTGQTRKFLLRFADGETVETVLMLYEDRKEQRDRRTLCVSTQVGCAMNCAFCATGISKFSRNLSTGEILAQVWAANHLLTPEKVTNIVLMGMGEPLANYDAVLKAIRLLNEEDALNIGIRRITISTSGLVPQIKALARENLGLVLAVSLHAPNDRLRNLLMPVNKKYPLAQLMDAVDEYITLTGKRVTFEYIMLRDVNDQPEHGEQLVALLKNKNVNVNLIPYNPVTEAVFQRAKQEQINAFKEILVTNGIETVIREEMGGEIDAACGQLRRRKL